MLIFEVYFRRARLYRQVKAKNRFLEGHRYTYSLKKIGRDKVELAVRNQGVLPGWENEEEL